MILPSERARISATKKTASSVIEGAVLVAVADHHEAMNGELIEGGTVVKVVSLVHPGRAWIVEKQPNGRWTSYDDALLVDLREYRRLVDVQFQGSVRGFISVSGFNGNGKRVMGPAMFDPETNAARLASDFRKLADIVEEFAADAKVATVVVSIT